MEKMAEQESPEYTLFHKYRKITITYREIIDKTTWQLAEKIFHN